jgi:hypothetical protein
MLYLKTPFWSAALLSFALLTPTASAQEPTPANEGNDMAIKQELAAAAYITQQQLIQITEEATSAYSKTLIDTAPNMPAAWMLLQDGETIKRIDIDKQAADAPAQLRIIMYRAALKSVARRGKINAAAILYTGKISADSDEEALVIEYEHRLGISATKVIPYEVKDGKVLYGEAVTTDKPFQLFYDSKEEFQRSPVK